MRPHMEGGSQVGSPQLAKWADYTAKLVVRGGIEPPAFRFSGLRITVQDRPQRSLWLLSDMPYTLVDTAGRGCMRLEMRLRTCGPGRARPWHQA